MIVRENVVDIEDYLQAADLGLFTSETESFCLSILEAMCFGCPSVATRWAGFPKWSTSGETACSSPRGRCGWAGARRGVADAGSRAADAPRDGGAAAGAGQFSAEAIVPRYEALYRRVCG